MSGHSKWNSIKHKKGIADKKRGKVFTRHAKLITIAAQDGGGDISLNPRLRTEIERAKSAGVPNANIDRAVKKGTGELGGDKMETLIYEGYGPGGVAILVQAMTDNKNRTVQNIRSTFSKYGGNMAESGSVAYLFKSCGIIYGKIDKEKIEEIELSAIEAGADDIQMDGENMEVLTDVSNFSNLKKTMEELGMKIESAELTKLPQTTVEAGENLGKIKKIIDILEELDDTDEVFCNTDLNE